MTPTDVAWPAGLTRMTGEQVRHYRSNRTPRLSAEQLAAEVTAAGVPYTRAQVTNLEAGRRTSITVGEVLALASVLGVPPLLLLLPIGRHDVVEVLPGVEADAWEAARWLVGDAPVPGRESDVQWRSTADVLDLYRQHAELVGSHPGPARIDLGETLEDVARTRAAVERQLQAVRVRIRDRGERPPALPQRLTHVDPDTVDVAERVAVPAELTGTDEGVEQAIAARRARRSGAQP